MKQKPSETKRLPIKTKYEKLWQQEGKTKTMPPRLTTWWLDKKRRSKQKERRAASKTKCQKYATPPSLRDDSREKNNKKRITAATECVNNKKANKFHHKQHVLQFGTKCKKRHDKATARQSYKAAKGNKQTLTVAATNQRCGDSKRRVSASVCVALCMAGWTPPRSQWLLRMYGKSACSQFSSGLHTLC